MYDKLDLLGVKYDVEMEQKAKYELAKEISSYWKINCTDEDFYKNCMENISNELGENATYEEVNEIWSIIEENFLKDEISDIGNVEGYKNHCIIKYCKLSEQSDFGFDDMYEDYDYIVIDKRLFSEKIAYEICDLSNDEKKQFVHDNMEIDIGTLAEWIDEEYLNDIRISIQNNVEEILNNHLEVLCDEI